MQLSLLQTVASPKLWHLTVLANLYLSLEHFGKLSEDMKISWSLRASIAGKKHFSGLADVKSVPVKCHQQCNSLVASGCILHKNEEFDPGLEEVRRNASGQPGAVSARQTTAKMEPADINRNRRKKPFKVLPIEIDGTLV